MSYDLYSQIESFDTKLTINTMSFLMEKGESLRIPAGQVVSREGDPSEHVYIIVEGVAGIEKKDGLGGKLQIARVESGGLIGEMGVFLDMKRSATVVAYSDLTLIRFTNQSFINALPKTPDITVRLLKSLAKKVDEANRLMSTVSNRNAMLVIGVHLLEEYEPSQTIHFNVPQFSQETGMEPGKVVSALKSLLKQRLIGQWQLLEGKILSFEIHRDRLKNALKTLASLKNNSDKSK